MAAAASSDLTPASVFAILLSLALVGGATIYYIRKKDEGEPGLEPMPHPALPPSAPGAQMRLPPRRMPAAPQPRRMTSPHDSVSDHDAIAASHAFRQIPTVQPAYHAPDAAHAAMDDMKRALADVAQHLRAAWQRGVDDVTVLQTAVQNPSLPDDKRDLARRALASAHIEIHIPRRRPTSPAQPPAPAHAIAQQQPYAQPYPPYVQHPAAHLDDAVHAAPWQDLAQQFDAQLGQWAHDVESWLPHPDAAQHPAPPAAPAVTYTPYPMPQPPHPHDMGPHIEHPHDATPPAPAHEEHHAPYVRGPTFWTDTARRLGLIKAGDRLINTQEAQHYINTIGTGVTLPETGELDSRTHEALRDFQSKHQLPVTGNLDPETSSALLYAAFVSATPQFIDPGF